MSQDADSIASTLARPTVRGGLPPRASLHLRPVWRVTVKGQDVSARMAPRLVRLSISDSREAEADEVELVISDHDGAVALPSTGDPLTVAIGWQASATGSNQRAVTQDDAGDFPLGLIDKGSYTIQAVEYSGAPDVITIRARAADMLDDLRMLRDQSWHATTVGAILRSIAGRAKLKARIDPQISVRKVKHADQAQESDASFVRRLGKQFDCIATIKAGCLLFSQARAARTPSGTALPAVQIVRRDGDSHRYARSDREAYSGVKAFYSNTKAGTRKSVVAGISGRAKTLRATFASEADALAAARAEWLRVQRGIYSFDITLGYGRADLMPQRPAVVTGYKPQIDETPWIITSVRHTLEAGGYTSQITLETMQAEGVEGGDEASANAD
ncbi:MAG: phage late control D family protein [Xanthomonadaceae bacterium]|nr:phage late control D family protein [Xanthomonadaceae bacterium]